MKRAFRLGGAGGDSGTWLLFVFLFVGVAVPMACVLWLTNQAARSEAGAARQAVVDAYRGQLHLLRERVDSGWAAHVAELNRRAGSGTPADFARMAASGLVDSIIYLNADGSAAYPSLYPALYLAPLAASEAVLDIPQLRVAAAAEAQGNWEAALNAYSAAAKAGGARAAQGEIRVLLKLPDSKERAIRAILDHFSGAALQNAKDPAGRVIAADEHLLALRLMGAKDPRRGAVLGRLNAWVYDYRSSMPSAQRLFLGRELLSLRAKPLQLAAFAAERLAAEFLEGDSLRAAGPGLVPTRAAGVWRLTLSNGRAVALLREETVVRELGRILARASSGSARFAVLPPGRGAAEESLPVSALLPGWQIALELADPREVEEASTRRRTNYLWLGYAMTAAICVTGLFAGRMFRRQLLLARLKTDMVAAVSHELKTPLASMSLLVDTLLDDARLDPQKTREYLELIAGENQRLTRLVENFLTFSRIERRRQHFEFRETEAAAVVQSACAALRAEPSFKLEIAVDDGLPFLYADADALTTVLVNLLENAVKYTRGEKRIEVRAFREGDGVGFSVSDNGIGIEAGEQKRIFRKFYQVDQRLARESGGVGLGLNIVESIVRAHGGTVRVVSKLGEGSTFTVHLPCLYGLGKNRAAAREPAA